MNYVHLCSRKVFLIVSLHVIFSAVYLNHIFLMQKEVLLWLIR